MNAELTRTTEGYLAVRRLDSLNKALLGIAVLLILLAVVLGGLGVAQLVGAQSVRSKPLLITGPSRVYQSYPNPIPAENQHAGSHNWIITHGSLHGEIQAYASTDSLAPGQSLTLHVSTTSPTFTIEVFRMGYYQGLGARAMYAVRHVPGVAQGYYPNTGAPASGPTNCLTCTLDPTTHEVSANWVANSPLDTITFPTSWLPGVYFIRLTEETTMKQWAMPVVLRDDTAHADVVLDLPFNTYEAYNYWGGTSLYDDYTPNPLAVKHAYMVSYNRPFEAYYGTEYLLSWTYELVKFMEAEGLNVRYTTDNAVDKGYTNLGRYDAFIIPGHSEYWTYNMRQALTNAIVKDKISVGFFSANSIYWQVRLSADGRTLIGYKDELPSVHHDPYDQSGNPNQYLTSALWRASPLNNPEDQILKEMYGHNSSGQGSKSPTLQDMVLTNTSNWAFSHTGLKNGAVIHKVLGVEVDVVTQDGSWGPNDNVTLLAQSPYTGDAGSHWTQTTTLDDIKVNGALTHQMIFDAGTIDWPYVMLNRTADGVALRQITWNLLYGMIHRTTVIPPIPTQQVFDDNTPVITGAGAD